LQRQTIFNSHENKQTNKHAIVFAQEVQVIIFAQQVESPQPPPVLAGDQVCALSVCAT
jgi:hypothetical protein